MARVMYGAVAIAAFFPCLTSSERPPLQASSDISVRKDGALQRLSTKDLLETEDPEHETRHLLTGRQNHKTMVSLLQRLSNNNPGDGEGGEESQGNTETKSSQTRAATEGMFHAGDLGAEFKPADVTGDDLKKLTVATGAEVEGKHGKGFHDGANMVFEGIKEAAEGSGYKSDLVQKVGDAYAIKASNAYDATRGQLREMENLVYSPEFKIKDYATAGEASYEKNIQYHDSLKKYVEDLYKMSNGAAKVVTTDYNANNQQQATLEEKLKEIADLKLAETPIHGAEPAKSSGLFGTGLFGGK